MEISTAFFTLKVNCWDEMSEHVEIVPNLRPRKFWVQVRHMSRPRSFLVEP
jgi:hypothetical protein